MVCLEREGICSKYDAIQDLWIESGRMLEGLVGIAHYFHPSLGLVMAGVNKEGDTDVSGVERTSDGENFISLPPLPAPLYGACMVITDEGVIYVTGGCTDRFDIFCLYDFVPRHVRS